MSGKYENSNARRKHTQRKGQITTIVACSFILVALVAILVVVLSVIKNRSENPQTEPTAPATVQPTLYIPTEPVSESPTRFDTDPTEPTEKPTEAATEKPTEKPTEPPTEKPTKAQPSPEVLEGALHYYAYGSTSTGYNWTYSSYGIVVDITCKYHFDQGMYDFIITGTEPGTTEFTLIYYTGDDETVSVPMRVSVDENLKVTRIE